MKKYLPTFGTPVTYVPVEFPKSGRNKAGQTASAKDAEGQAGLEAAGFEFPVFHANKGDGTVDGLGNAIQEYPRVLHGPGGKTVQAKDPDKEAELIEQGWTVDVQASSPAPPAKDPAAPNMPVPSNAAAEILTRELLGMQDKVQKLEGELADAKRVPVGDDKALVAMTAERDELQARFDHPMNKKKQELQRELATVTDERDALLTKLADVEAAYNQLLTLSTAPAPAEE